MSDISQYFIIETLDLVSKKEKMEQLIEYNFTLIFPRIKQMLSQYRKALDELRREFNTKNDFYGFSIAKDSIQSVKNCESFFEIKALVIYNINGSCCELESFNIPYCSSQDHIFVEKFKNEERLKYMEKIKKKEAEERKTYETLKNKFESTLQNT